MAVSTEKSGGLEPTSSMKKEDRTEVLIKMEINNKVEINTKVKDNSRVEMGGTFLPLRSRLTSRSMTTLFWLLGRSRVIGCT